MKLTPEHKQVIDRIVLWYVLIVSTLSLAVVCRFLYLRPSGDKQIVMFQKTPNGQQTIRQYCYQLGGDNMVELWQCPTEGNTF
jgi:hypothetical protein